MFNYVFKLLTANGTTPLMYDFKFIHTHFICIAITGQRGLLQILIMHNYSYCANKYSHVIL